MSVTNKFKKLDEIEHCLLRPSRYIGSINPHTEIVSIPDQETLKMVDEEFTYVPGLLKLFDEAISNSVDFSKTDDGKHLTEIRVNINTMFGEISVFDNGGIHVLKHPDHDQWIPEMIFELRSGSNFNDSDEVADNDYNTGQNGEGVALNVIFSEIFKVETSDGKNKFYQEHSNNSRDKTIPKITKCKEQYTKLSWIPDYAKFGLSDLNLDNYKMIQKRTVDIAGCNPNLKVYFNDKLIKIKSFEDYIRLYCDDFIFEENEFWKVGVAYSENGFSHISFVNSTSTKLGGPHVDYISNQIVVRLREFFKKKHKSDIKPSDIKNHFRLFIDAKIKKPRYDSQTKDFLITEVKSFGTSIELSDKFIKSILKTEIVQSILDWITAKDSAQLNADLRRVNKDLDRRNLKEIEGFHECSTKNRKDASLFLCEGVSALSGLLSGRNPKVHACFALRGKPINVVPMTVKEIIENKEFKNILSIIGLQIGTPVEELPQSEEWYSIQIENNSYIVNGNDREIIINGKTYTL